MLLLYVHCMQVCGCLFLFFYVLLFFLMLPMIMLLLNIIVNWAGRHFSVVQKYYLVHDQIFNTVFNYRLFLVSKGCGTDVIEFLLFIDQLNLIMLFNVATLKAACRNVRYMRYMRYMRYTKYKKSTGDSLLSLINVSDSFHATNHKTNMLLGGLFFRIYVCNVFVSRYKVEVC